MKTYNCSLASANANAYKKFGMVKNGILEEWFNNPEISENDIKKRIKELMYSNEGSVAVQATKLAGQTKALFTDKVEQTNIDYKELYNRVRSM